MQNAQKVKLMDGGLNLKQGFWVSKQAKGWNYGQLPTWNMEMPEGLEGGGGGCGTPGLWLTAIRWAPATLAACGPCRQAQWQKPKHERSKSPKRNTDLMKDTQTMNMWATSVWDDPYHAAATHIPNKVWIWKCVFKFIYRWRSYLGCNNAVGTLHGDCVQVSLWKQSWRNASFSAPLHPTDPGQKHRETLCVRKANAVKRKKLLVLLSLKN